MTPPLKTDLKSMICIIDNKLFDWGRVSSYTHSYASVKNITILFFKWRGRGSSTLIVWGHVNRTLREDATLKSDLKSLIVKPDNHPNCPIMSIQNIFNWRMKCFGASKFPLIVCGQAIWTLRGDATPEIRPEIGVQIPPE